MNARIKELRKSLGLTQQEFANRLRVKRNTVGQWECGINALTDQMVFSICREFGVSETWLRTGEGEMLATKTKQTEIADITARLFKMDSDSKQYKFIVALSEYLLQLDEKEMQSMLDLIRKLSDAVGDQGE
nr:MAG TPA: helix-turn-helix domain protein [Caudoviricetes sp.]